MRTLCAQKITIRTFLEQILIIAVGEISFNHVSRRCRVNCKLIRISGLQRSDEKRATVPAYETNDTTARRK